MILRMILVEIKNYKIVVNNFFLTPLCTYLFIYIEVILYENFRKFNNKLPIKILKAKMNIYNLSKYGKVLDFTSGWTGFASLGHNNTNILNAIKSQMKILSKAIIN